MQKSYFAYGFAIAVDALAIGAGAAIACLAWWLATGATGAYMTVLANLLFLIGGLILVFGSMIELLRLGGTSNIHGLLMSPIRLLGIPDEKTGQGLAGRWSDEESAGWPLIFLGLAVIALSVVALFVYLI